VIRSETFKCSTNFLCFVTAK